MNNAITYFAVIMLTAIAAGIVIIISKYFRDLKAVKERIKSLGSQVIETACAPTEYARVGEGYPVLIVHGAIGGFDQGLYLARSFSLTNYKVVSISRFGHLRSPVPPGANLDTQADAYACLLDALKIQRAAVIGVSAGSTSAIRFAARHPKRVSSLILFSPDAPGKFQMALPPRFVFDKLFRSDFFFWILLTFFEKYLRKSYGLAYEGYNLTAEQDAVIHNIVLGDLPTSQRMDGVVFETYTTAREYEESILPSSPYPLNKIKTPVLVIYAKDDPIVNEENISGMVGQMPNVTSYIAKDGGHLLFGHTDEVLAEITKFLRDTIDEPQ